MVELLVAVVLSSIVIITVYFVFSANTRQYYTQEQTVQMQEAMRFALEYLKTDLRNAGRHSTVVGSNAVGVGDPGYCRATPPGAELRGVQLFEQDEGQPLVLSANNNGLAPDRLRILADASGDVRLSAEQNGGDSVRVSAVQRTTEATQVVSSAPRFLRTYRAGYYLRIENLDSGQFDLVPIRAVAHAGGGPTVTLARPTCVPACISGRCLVNPVQLVEYVVRPDPPNNRNAPKTDLVRRVIDANDGATELPDVTVTVGEYVVNFQVWGHYDLRADASLQPDIPEDANPADTLGNAPGGLAEGAAMRNRLRRLRTLSLLLAVRTPREDPEMLVAPDLAVRAADRIAGDRSWFDLTNPGDPALARVATLSTEVEAPNMKKVF